MTTNLYRDLLLSSGNRLGIWGAGYLGYSELLGYSATGVTCVVTDYRPERLEELRAADGGTRDFLRHLYGVAPLAGGGWQVTGRAADLLRPDVPVIIVGVPTMDGNKPSNTWLREVLEGLATIPQIGYAHPPLVIIESMLVPGTLDTLVLPFLRERGVRVGADLRLGLCRRRDWYDDDGRVTNRSRVVGGIDALTVEQVASVFRLVNTELIACADYRLMELIKPLENAYRQLCISLANQLALAYPGVDVAALMRLAATRNDVPLVQPSFGTGGYNLPLASQFLIEGAAAPEYLTLLQESLHTDFGMYRHIAELLKRRAPQRIAVLGLAYKPNLNITVMSPTLRLIEALRGSVPEIRVCEPYLTDEQVRETSGCEPVAYPDVLRDCDAVVIGAAHRQFRLTPPARLRELLRPGMLVIDNGRAWQDAGLREFGVDYRVVGTAGWRD